MGSKLRALFGVSGDTKKLTRVRTPSASRQRDRALAVPASQRHENVRKEMKIWLDALIRIYEDTDGSGTWRGFRSAKTRTGSPSDRTLVVSLSVFDALGSEPNRRIRVGAPRRQMCRLGKHREHLRLTPYDALYLGNTERWRRKLCRRRCSLAASRSCRARSLSKPPGPWRAASA